MKTIFWITCLLITIHYSHAQSSKDSAAIRLTALHYIEGWYEGNFNRMQKAVHPNLVKRNVGWSFDHRNNNNVLSEMSAAELIDNTAKRMEKPTPKGEQVKSIFILDIYNNSASVKVEMKDWIDYLHLTRWNGEWKIINILWEMKPQQ